MQEYGDEQDVEFEDAFQIKNIFVGCGYKFILVTPKKSVHYDCMVIALDNNDSSAMANPYYKGCQFYKLEK